MATLIQKRAAIINAAAALNARADFIGNLIADVNRETKLGKGHDPETFFGPLGLGAEGAQLWQDQGERIGWAMHCFITDAMRHGATLEEATLAAWAEIEKPDVVVILHPDDGTGRTITPTACPFPVGAPLSVWALIAPSREAALVIAAGDNASVLAALTAAQPSA